MQAPQNSSHLSGGPFWQVTKPRWERSRPDNPKDTHMGWPFAKSKDEVPDASPDPLEGAKFIRDLYEIADPATAKFSVPVLWDKVGSVWLMHCSKSSVLTWGDPRGRFVERIGAAN